MLAFRIQVRALHSDTAILGVITQFAPRHTVLTTMRSTPCACTCLQSSSAVAVWALHACTPDTSSDSVRSVTTSIVDLFQPTHVLSGGTESSSKLGLSSAITSVLVYHRGTHPSLRSERLPCLFPVGMFSEAPPPGAGEEHVSQ